MHFLQENPLIGLFVIFAFMLIWDARNKSRNRVSELTATIHLYAPQGDPSVLVKMGCRKIVAEPGKLRFVDGDNIGVVTSLPYLIFWERSK